MPEQMIDLAGRDFWLAFFFAVLVLTPLRSARLRPWVWALSNIAFLKLLLYPWQLAVVLSAVAVVFLALRLTRWQFGIMIAGVVLGGGTLALFLFHKVATLASAWHVTQFSAVLSAIGFSYVALRLTDLLRAVLVDGAPPPSLPSTLNYLLPFHMLAAGPIQNYADFAAQQPVPAPLTLSHTMVATERIALGLVKKFIFASALQRMFLTGFSVSGWYFLFEIQVFYVWLYLDFSALCDVAVGVGTLLGVATPENFDRPYLARNMINFWERWHITLSQFIRRNIYIPLQLWLVRRSRIELALWWSSCALAVSFVLCGLWHGISVRYLLWGLWHATGVVAAVLFRQYLTRKLGTKGYKRYLEHTGVRLIAIFVTFEFVAFSLVIIQAPLKVLWP